MFNMRPGMILSLQTNVYVLPAGEEYLEGHVRSSFVFTPRLLNSSFRTLLEFEPTHGDVHMATVALNFMPSL